MRWIRKSKCSIKMKHLCAFVTVFILVFNQCYSRDVLPQKETYLPNYSIYHNLSRIHSEVRNIARKHLSYVHVNWKFTSRNGISQPVLRVTNFTHNSNSKVKILLSYGEHARELLPVESMFYLLNNITCSYDSTSKPVARFASNLLSNVDLYVVAIVNPDGRKYIEKQGNYCWRGTSTGVDLNRNFDWNFGAQGSSKNPQDEEYRGRHPFSGPFKLLKFFLFCI